MRYILSPGWCGLHWWSLIVKAFVTDSIFGRDSYAPQHSLGASQTHPFPQLNFHRARVRRTHGRPRPNGFTGRARNYLPTFTPRRERASGKALTLSGSPGFPAVRSTRTFKESCFHLEKRSNAASREVVISWV